MSRRREILTLVALLAVAGGAIAAPPSMQDRVRTTLRDAAAPSQRGLRAAVRHVDAWLTARLARRTDCDPAGGDVDEELEAARRTIRALEVAVATLREEKSLLNATGAAPWRGESGEPLFRHELLSATVLGTESSGLVRQGKLLDLGTADGAVESSLVLDDPRPLVDQGENAGLTAGQPVFAGRCVVGRVVRVGRRVSTVIPVTDPEFRGLAGLVRGEGEQAVFGAEGLLEGAADGRCRLKHIPATEAVTTGDRVCTAGSDASGPEPMIYGVVESAELPSGASHWEIVVRPVVEWNRLRTVQVLRTRLRAAAGSSAESDETGVAPQLRPGAAGAPEQATSEESKATVGNAPLQIELGIIR